MRRLPAQPRAKLAARLERRREEIEQATLTRAYAIFEPGGTVDPLYAEGLRTAVSAAIKYGITALERGEERAPPIPPALLVQARVAARNGVSLETVLRRYFAGYTLLCDFIVDEAKADESLGSEDLQAALRDEAALFDQLVSAVGNEYAREHPEGHSSAERRRTKRIQRLLDGERVDTSELRYDLDTHHLGLIVAGEDAAEAIRALATALDRRLLLVRDIDHTVWAWLGGRKTDPERIEEAIQKRWSSRLTVAIGEPADGIAGWRLTHMQARTALSVGLRKDQWLTRYRDVAVLAAVAQNDLLAAYLRQRYIGPISSDENGGQVGREALRAYFGAAGNISSAAAQLGLHRNTLVNRLRACEASLERSIPSCRVDIEIALQLDELGT